MFFFHAGIVLKKSAHHIRAVVVALHADNEAAQIAAGVTTSGGTQFCRQCIATKSTMFQYPDRRSLKTSDSFESAWRSVSIHAALGAVEENRKGHGVKRVSAVRDLPTVRARFHSLFSQDPMHDFCEGVLPWTVTKVLQEGCKTLTEVATAGRQLEAARKSISPTLKFPRLSTEELQGTKWQLNGTHNREKTQLMYLVFNE